MAPQETSSEQESAAQAVTEELRPSIAAQSTSTNHQNRQAAAQVPAATAETSNVRPLEAHEWADWDKLVTSSPQGSIFCRSWWINAVVDHPLILCYFEGGRLIAGLPLAPQKKFGIQMSLMPPLTQTWGIVMPPLNGKRAAVYSRETEIIRVFATYLKKIPFVFHQFHPNMANWLPFYWKHFHQTTRCSYAIEDLSDLGRVWDNMAPNARTKIRKVEKEGIKVSPCSVDLIFEMEVKTFARQSKSLGQQRYRQLTGIFEASKAQNCVECVAAIDPAGKPHAASLFVWDEQRTYYLAGGGDPEFRASGAQSFLVWYAIQQAAGRSKAFDFCGSNVKAIDQFVRSFGPSQILFHRIVKCPWWMILPLVATGKL